MKLDGHAQSEEEQVRVSILGAVRPVGQFETGCAVHCAIYTGYLVMNSRRKRSSFKVELSVRTVTFLLYCYVRVQCCNSLYLNVRVVIRDRNELRQAFAEPHGDVSLHVDGKRLEAFLQATDSEIAQAADILTQVDPPHLREAQTTHRDKTYRNKIKPTFNTTFYPTDVK